MGLCLEGGHELFHVRVVRNVDERGGVGHHVTALTQVGKVAQCFHGFHGEDDVGCSLGNQVGIDRLVGDTHVGLHVSPALAHSVGFGLLHV